MTSGSSSSGVATARKVPEIGTAPDRFALIIGAMKSGTTTLFEVLGQHPEIAAAAEKEPNFFSTEQVYERGPDWYLGLWDWNPAVHRIALEASPAYTTYPARPGVPRRIAAMKGADFRFIYILRNPLEQIESNVRHTLFAGWGTSLDDGVPEWMIETASYAMQLEQYLEVFSEERFLILTLEEYSQQPDAVLRRICRFLEVDADFAFRGTAERYNTGNVYEVAEVWARLVKSDVVRSIARRVMPRGARHRLRKALGHLPGRKATMGRHTLTGAERVEVVGRLSEDLRRLQHRYGVQTRRYWSIDDGTLTG